METLPEKVRQAWADREGPAILTTMDADGTPNAIYASAVGMFGDGRIVVADNYFDKTRRNIQRGSRAAILFMTKQRKAYQVKGVLEYHTSGPVFDDMKKWNPPKHPGHAAAALVAEAVYSGAERIA